VIAFPTLVSPSCRCSHTADLLVGLRRRKLCLCFRAGHTATCMCKSDRPLIWCNAQAKDIEMPFGRFLRMGIITMLPSTVVCLAFVWLETTLF